MTPRFYTLIGQTAVPIEGNATDVLLQWAREFEDGANRVVFQTDVWFELAQVSTVFLGMDRRHGHSHGPPILFETMVFWEMGTGPDMQTRYSTWSEAEEGHRAMVAEIQSPAYLVAALLASAREYCTDAWGDLKHGIRELMPPRATDGEDGLGLDLEAATHRLRAMIRRRRDSGVG